MQTVETNLVSQLSLVSKGFTDGDRYHQVLDCVDLALHSGDTIALTGPSGTGKSTLLNIIAGFEKIDSGELQLLGQQAQCWQDNHWSHFRRQQLGIVFQQFNLLTPLNVLDNIRFPLQLNKLKWSPWADELINQLDLREVLARPVETLSGGQQQRVAIARALIHKPSLLLADEPTGNLDEKAGQQVMQLLCELAQAANTTILMVTHSDTCANYMQRRWHLEQGKIHE
ncbi:ABC transporter ATP-binding protein [Shewanella sp. 1_MG-2023]|uniref:ABC transporter ATP-binding protein n=1 Tax=Shewanella electrodiphila TaxID=934143 RepID=A0ABT0KS79_9GAMM|nr:MULTISPECIES: ABC transporter ATP-binding protein [Shewanella]MCC4831666.1 ABC transporter ATP-binding protein [Shewanella sp. 10N.7]MCL1046613.1 ABC transporter ATP-binding protein [Shewanella electrodiphila]MDO6611099.1 ABC transporter ATP-binding protein [Shewanella sp. 7_MG-2023]MDO6771024.1 ABC transporter ATP-binding protein [Shewanella sp. 2_MG-2023]MDO6795626.1 ABC transporter ATP-binding protein [Shewanella sp. 1_MG-2023]